MGRNSPNLYELLKQTGAKPDDPAADAAVRTATPPPMKLDPSPAAPEPAAMTPLRPAVAAPSAKRPGLGERSITLTFNAIAFAALVVVGVVFVAYAIGVRVGRAGAPAPAPAAPAVIEPSQPPPTPQVYTIRLMEWSARTTAERTHAQGNAVKLKNALDGRQLGGSEIKPAGDRVLLNFGRFADPNAREAKEKLAQLREFRLNRNEQPVFRGAGFARVE